MTTNGEPSRSEQVDTAPPSALATLLPGYFALVMATGIIAVAAQLLGVRWLAQVLYAIAAVAFVVLSVLYVVRLIRYTEMFIADLTSHAKGFAFLTIVAGANVLGSASAVVHGWWGLARVLWWISLALWFVLLYTALISVIIRHEKPPLAGTINGTWFLLTVSTESIAALGALLLLRGGGELLAFVCIAAFTLGLVLYLIVMTAIFMRWTLQQLDPTEIDPPAWIAAGAVAITVLAGSNLLLARHASARIESLVPFLEGMVILAWATATFWFPLLVAVGVWRHIVRRLPLRYHPASWAMVFPLGMYATATFRMRDAIDLSPLEWFPKVAFAISLVAWAAVFLGLVWQGVSAVSRWRSAS